MKIGVVTFHHARHSYGATLQSYATVKALRQLGCEAELINYENEYEQTEIKCRDKSVKRRIFMHLSSIVRMYLFNGWRDPYRDNRQFDALYGQTAKRPYKTIEEMKGLTYDVLLVGSDQVWNPEVTGGLDDVYLLEFGKAKKRISYASSMGSHRLSREELSRFKKALASFSAVSVREDFAKNQLQEITGHDIRVVVDPTLLLAEEDWRETFQLQPGPMHGRPYILTYFVGGNIDTYQPVVKEYADVMELPIWNIQAHSKRYQNVERPIFGITVEELLRYIDQADLVITDSFHGTVFSLIFKKKFVSLPNRGNPVRVRNLLRMAGVEARSSIAPKDVKTEIDYDNVTRRLTTKREESLEWLSEAVGVRRGE